LEASVNMRKSIFAIILLATCASAQAQPCRTSQPSIASEKTVSGWARSYRSGCLDRSGKLAAGTEIIHIVEHGGKLFAAVGYWMDPRNIWYGGNDPAAGWAQILRLDSPTQGWQVDLSMPRHLRAEILKSVTFTTDGNGKALATPVQLLLASTYEGGGEAGISLFTRDDATGRWQKSKIIAADTGQRGEFNSVRAMRVHKDATTGVDRLFVSIGKLGIYSGVYDPAAPGAIRWDNRSESGSVETRPLAIVEANGSLLFSAGALVYRRVDGKSPSYETIVDMSSAVPADAHRIAPNGATDLSQVGGIRGLTAIPYPKGSGQSLLFVWAPGSKGSRGCTMRLDPDGRGGYERVEEVCLDKLLRRYLDNTPVHYVLGAYDDFFPVRNPETGQTNYLIGLEVWIASGGAPIGQPGKRGGGFYAGALYAIRDERGGYRIAEVNGRYTEPNPVLSATRVFAVSPLEGERGQAIYFGGYDCANLKSSDTAWIFKADLATALLVRRRTTGAPTMQKQ
jgi:hypothetical protein